MNNLKKYIFVFLSIFLIVGIGGCTDDAISPEPPEENDAIDSNLPEEIRNGYSIKFNIQLSPIGGGSYSLTRASSNETNAYLREIENFIDLEKLRILFFVCVPEIADSEPDPSVDKKAFKEFPTTDYFLFESKSRFVAQLSDSESSTARWQVTAPVFTYGNNDEYDWEAIRYALTHYNFKIALLVNRPNNIDFGNFDNKFNSNQNDGRVSFTTDRGPMWGVEHSWIDPSFRNSDKYAGKSEDYWKSRPTINDLHHCQWDAVYTSKNNLKHVYDFIMGNPHDTDQDGGLPYPKDIKPGEEGYDDASEKLKRNRNMMGALSSWTQKKGNDNYYFHPSFLQGIPMYGVQKFTKLGDSWAIGTPFNVSTQSNYNGDNIHLLRSLAKLELKIPRQMQKSDGTWVDIRIENPCLRYSNVMARCEPLDVETPTELLWSENENSCEWNDIFKYGPIVNGRDGNFNSYKYGGGNEYEDKYLWSLEDYQKRMAWFYGAWKRWWHFNMPDKVPNYEYTYIYEGDHQYSNVEGLKDWSYFDLNEVGKYPHIYNPVVQRNGTARIDDCQIADDKFYHYVVYTGERNINDPSNLSYYTPHTAEAAYFSFNVICPELELTAKDKDGKEIGIEYCIALTDYSKNGNKWILENFIKKNNCTVDKMREYTRDYLVVKSNEENWEKHNWNWPLLRNHLYSFTVTKIGGAEDNGGIDVQVVTSENRYAPTLEYH